MLCTLSTHISLCVFGAASPWNSPCRPHNGFEKATTGVFWAAQRKLGWRRSTPTKQTECGTQLGGNHREVRVARRKKTPILGSVHREVSWLAERLAGEETRSSLATAEVTR